VNATTVGSELMKSVRAVSSVHRSCSSASDNSCNSGNLAGIGGRGVSILFSVSSGVETGIWLEYAVYGGGGFDEIPGLGLVDEVEEKEGVFCSVDNELGGGIVPTRGGEGVVGVTGTGGWLLN
jgi:hypothetical protein